MSRAVLILPAALMLCAFTGYGSMGDGAPRTGITASGDTVTAGFDGDKLAQYYYTEGIKRFKIENDAEGALQLFDKAIEADPYHAPSYYQAASAAVSSNTAAALEYGRKAAQLDTANVWYAGLLARLLIFSGDFNGARKTYEKLIGMQPKNPEYYYMLAMLYEQTGQPYAAIATLDRAENTIGKMEQLARHKRDLLLAAGLTDQAIEQAKEVIEAYPYDYEGYLSLAEIYAETRKDSLAAENYRMASSLNPEGLDVIGSMNEFYRIIGDSEKYLSTAKKLVQSPGINKEMKLKLFRDITADRNFYRDNYFQIRDIAGNLFLLYPDDYEVVTLYASNVRAWGNFDEATGIHKEYIATPRDDLQPYMDVISMEAFKQRHDSVKKYTELALERFPTDPELYVRLGGTQSYLGNEKDALKSFEKALKYVEGDSARSVILGVIGDEYHKQGNDKKSYRYYDQALAAWDGNVVVLNNYAYFLSEQEKDLDKALEMARRVMELEPSNATYIDTYGWVLFKMGRLEEAKTAIRQAIALDTTNSSELLIHYGDVLHQLGDGYMSEVYWKRALEAGHDEDEITRRLSKSAE